MKKRSLTSLKLNKKSISNLGDHNLNGGQVTSNAMSCETFAKNTFLSCFNQVCHSAIFCTRDCESGVCLPWD